MRLGSTVLEVPVLRDPDPARTEEFTNRWAGRVPDSAAGTAGMRDVPSKRFGTHAVYASALFAAAHRARQRGGTGTLY